MQNRLLVFDSDIHLEYWFKYIVNKLKDTELLFEVKKNDYIRYGTQKWIFRVDNKFVTVGWHDIPIFYSVEYKLEKDFTNTMINIVKGESNGN